MRMGMRNMGTYMGGMQDKRREKRRLTGEGGRATGRRRSGREMDGGGGENKEGSRKD